MRSFLHFWKPQQFDDRSAHLLSLKTFDSGDHCAVRVTFSAAIKEHFNDTDTGLSQISGTSRSNHLAGLASSKYSDRLFQRRLFLRQRSLPLAPLLFTKTLTFFERYRRDPTPCNIISNSKHARNAVEERHVLAEPSISQKLTSKAHNNLSVRIQAMPVNNYKEAVTGRWTIGSILLKSQK